MMMLTDELVTIISRRTGLTKTKSAEVIDIIKQTVISELKAGGCVRLKNFGTFYVKKKAPTVGRNPSAGEIVAIAGRNVPSFKPSAYFRKVMGY